MYSCRQRSPRVPTCAESWASRRTCGSRPALYLVSRVANLGALRIMLVPASRPTPASPSLVGPTHQRTNAPLQRRRATLAHVCIHGAATHVSQFARRSFSTCCPPTLHIPVQVQCSPSSLADGAVSHAARNGAVRARNLFHSRDSQQPTAPWRRGRKRLGRRQRAPRQTCRRQGPGAQPAAVAVVKWHTGKQPRHGR